MELDDSVVEYECSIDMLVLYHYGYFCNLVINRMFVIVCFCAFEIPQIIFHRIGKMSSSEILYRVIFHSSKTEVSD